jgi:hypothetical protein
VTGRLHPFVFVLLKDGIAAEFVFYAPSRAVAVRYAETWASDRGWTVGEQA